MLTIEGLSLIRDQKIVFQKMGFSLSISSALIVRGSNGSGKSSLLQIIAGLVKPNCGRILWGGREIKEFYSDFYGDMQFLGHKNFLKPELTIKENLSFFAKISDSLEAVKSALHFFELDEIADRKISELSAGWQQKVLLAKLLACPATIWLLDESSSHLDSAGRKKFYELIKTRIKNRGLVIMATHDEMFFDLGPNLFLEDFA